MRNKLLKKLHSERGASITFALLLFLVCAAVGSVVLASATATAGRVSENYAFDQRYYAVSSAAELLRDSLNGQTRTVKLEKQTARADVTRVEFDADGKVVYGPVTTPGDTDVTYPGGVAKLNGTNAINAASANLIDQALLRLTGSKSAADIFTSGSLSVLTGPETRTLLLTVSGPGDASGLTVKVTETLQPDGSLTYQLENESGTDKYRLELTLTASVNRRTEISEVTTPTGTAPADPENGGSTATVQTSEYQRVETQTYTVTWKASAINVV